MAKQTGARLSRDLLRRKPIGDAASAAMQQKAARLPMGGDSLKNFVAALGTLQDKRSHSHYAFPLTLTRVEIENMFRASWVAKRIVRTPADDMCRAWVDRTWDGWDEPGDTSAKQLKIAEKKFGVRGKFNEGLSWAQLYGGAVIVPDLKGQEDWSQPLTMDSIKQGDLRSLHVLDRWRCAATGELDYDRRSPNYGYPKYYTISDVGTYQFQIHWSRAIRFNGEPLPWFLWVQNAFWQDSVLQHTAEVIRDYDATMAGIAGLVYEASVDVVTTPGLATALAAGGKAQQNVVDRWALTGTLKSNNHMMLLDGGEVGGPESQAKDTWQQKTTAFSGLKDVAEKFMIAVCGAADIPMTRLFGQSPAGLTATGESDIRNYYDRLSSLQERQMRPALEKVDEILFRHLLGFMPNDYELTFRPLWQVTDKERAEIEKLQAERDQIYLVQGAIPEHVVTGDLLDKNTYRSLTQKDVDLVERLAAQAAAVPAVGKLGEPATKAAPLVGSAEGSGGEGGAGHPFGAHDAETADKSTSVQTWVFAKTHFDETAARAWAKKHDLKAEPRETMHSWRFQQVEPEAFAPSSFRTIQIAPGITAVIGKRKGQDVIREEGGRFFVYSEGGKRLGGPYKTKAQAAKRLGQVEYFKSHKE